MRAHDKKIWPKQFKEGELVLKRILQNRQDPHEKWSPNWERPYVVKNAFLGRALIFIEMDGKKFPEPINVNIVKKYYAWGNKGSDLSELKTRKGDSSKQRWKEKETEEKKKRVWGENPKGQFKPQQNKKMNEWKKKKKSRGQVENPKRATWLQRGFLDWKPGRAV